MMDAVVKKRLNKFFLQNYSKIYKSSPNLKSCGNDYYYTVSKENKIICLLAINKI